MTNKIKKEYRLEVHREGALHMNKKSILFKGMLDGLHIHVEPDIGLETLKESLEAKFKKGERFFEGTSVNLIFTGKKFSQEEKRHILDFISPQINLGTIKFSENTNEEKSDSQYFDGIEEGMTRFYRGTIRNGQRISYEGNVVVIGDVNPGGEVIAGGNIVIFGALRGMAHAGASGNHEAIVVAFCLQPTQLRIGSIITRPPEGDTSKPSYPELARIKDGNLIIEPCLPGRGK